MFLRAIDYIDYIMQKFFSWLEIKKKISNTKFNLNCECCDSLDGRQKEKKYMLETRLVVVYKLTRHQF